MTVKIVTSFNKRIFEEYGNKTLQTWVDNIGLEQGSEIEVWINGPFPQGLPKQTFNGTPIKYKFLDTQSEGWKYFWDNFGNHPKPKTPPGQEFRFNFLPFSCKVYALAEAAWAARQETSSVELLLWLDADVTLKKPLTEKDLYGILDKASMAWLDRGAPWFHGETGFILVSNKNDNLDIFLNQANIYGSGALFYHAEWHDAFVFTSQVRLKQFTDTSFIVRNLNTDMKSEYKQGLYPFETSILSEWMDHHKGQLKQKVN